MTFDLAPGAAAPTSPRDYPSCGRCSACHPGRQFGGDAFCQKRFCRCHRVEEPWEA